MILDRYTYRWGFVFRVKPEKPKTLSKETKLPKFNIIYFDKSYIENLKLETPFK